MANTLLTPTVIAKQALAILTEQVIASKLVNRNYEPDFRGAVGDTITIRKPASFTANVFNRASGITIQNATETSQTVALNTLLDVSFAVTAEELTLKIDDFSTQLLAPAVQALVDGIESRVCAALITNSGAEVGATTADPKILVDAAKYLNDNKVPQSPRHVLLSTAQAANFLKDALFHQAHQLGSTAGLQDASLGKKFGFNTWQSTWMTKSVAFHPDSVTLVNRTLAAPLGAANVAVVNAEGFGLRVTYGYNQTLKQDVVSIDTLIGIAALRGTVASVQLNDGVV